MSHDRPVLGTTSRRRRPGGCGHGARSRRPAGTGQWPVKRASRRSVKLRSPSAASWLRMVPGSGDAIQSRAASGPRPSPARAGRGGLHAQRGLLGDKMRQVCGPLDVGPAGTTSCTSPIRDASAAPDSSAVSRKRLALPQPGCAGAEGGSAERHDAAAGLQLAEPRIVGGDHDAGGRRQLDRQGERDAVDRYHHRLGRRVAPDPGRVEAVRAAQHLRAVPGHRRVRPVNSRVPSRCPAAPGRHHRHLAARRSWSRSFAPW
jgi:hypothetical protein